MNIKIVNLRNYVPKQHLNEVLIRVERSTVVGNPFYMHNESERNEVCNLYKIYFDEQMRTRKSFKEYIDSIVEISRTHNIALGCWCAPKRCHAETIMQYIKEVI